MKRISKVSIKRIFDESPDTSYIGEYSATWKEGAIDRKERGDMRCRDYRYFLPANPEYAEQEYARMESLCNGDFHFIGIRAEAEIQTSDDGRHWLCNTISSGGLWGIESDSGDDYFAEVERDELAALRDALTEFGFTADEIDAAIGDVERIA